MAQHLVQLINDEVVINNHRTRLHMQIETIQPGERSVNRLLIDRVYPFLDGHIIVFWLDRSGRFIRINQSVLDMSGYQEVDLIGSSYSLLKHPENHGVVTDELHRNLKSGKRWKGLIKVLRKDGACFWGLTTIMPVKYQSSNIRYLCTMRKPSDLQVIAYKEKHFTSTKAG